MTGGCKRRHLLLKKNMNDIERLLNTTLPFVEDLLKKYGEFYPVAGAVKMDDSISQIGTYDGNEHPLSEDVIESLKKGALAYQSDYKAFAIFYNVSIMDSASKEKIDAIAVLVESRNVDESWTLYYSYTLTGHQLSFCESWRIEKKREILLQ